MTSTEKVEFTGLAALRGKREDRAQAQENRDRPKATWFTINGGESLTVRFLQELDESSPNYNPKFGVYLGLVERYAHGRNGFLSRALDTTELDPEGRDFAEEMLKKSKGKELGWKRRENFYINVAVDRGDAKPSVEILSRNLYSSFVEDLSDENDEHDNSITNATYTIKRTGTGKDTAWKLRESKEELDIEGLEPWDLKTHAVRHIPYEKQREWYLKNYTPAVTEDEEPRNDGSDSSDEEPKW